MRGRSYSPSPPRVYGRRGRSPSARGRYGGRDRDAPTSLLVRNLHHDCRQEDLRRPFGQFGPLKDIYLPRDYYTGGPRGFGFVQFVDPVDAADAQYHMDGQILLGRQLTVVYAEENRKKPSDMRAREPPSGRYNDRRQSRYSRSPRYSRSSPSRYARSRSHSRDYSPAPKRRSVSHRERRYSRDRSYTRSPVREISPLHNGSRSRSCGLVREHSPPYIGSRGRSRSPLGERSPSGSGSPREEPNRDASHSQ